MIIETQAVINWLDENKIHYLIEKAILLPDYQLALRVMEHKEETASELIWRELLENQGWDVINLQTSDIQTNLGKTMRRALKGEVI